MPRLAWCSADMVTYSSQTRVINILLAILKKPIELLLFIDDINILSLMNKPKKIKGFIEIFIF